MIVRMPAISNDSAMWDIPVVALHDISAGAWIIEATDSTYRSRAVMTLTKMSL